jgi:DNA polymerase-3 subunit epsilon
MREIVLDTETTGFDPQAGDRLVEIGCIELSNHVPTGRNFHRYLNPERDMPEAAFRIHGLTAAFLADKAKFADLADDFLAFIDTAPLVIHNAEFDMKFINWELEKSGRRALPMQRSIDTVKMARTRFPGAPASLDALCKRFGIDNSNRTLHGALLDAQLLADVYLELLGGRQTGLTLVEDAGGGDLNFARRGAAPGAARPVRQPRPHAPNSVEAEAHAAFVARMKDALWLQ